jgi:AcrR family transcriptional regulator
MNRNIERGRATREHLVQVATGLFATRGYEATSIEAVLQESGVSRGSLYHHFPGKEALFWAVLESLQIQVTATLAEARGDVTNPVDALRVDFLAWIRLAATPTIKQIVLTDAPAVLGWQRLRDLDEQYVLGGIRSAVAAAAESGAVDAIYVDLFSHLILAAGREAAQLMARSEDPTTALPGTLMAVDEFLRRLLG